MSDAPVDAVDPTILVVLSPMLAHVLSFSNLPHPLHAHFYTGPFGGKINGSCGTMAEHSWWSIAWLCLNRTVSSTFHLPWMPHTSWHKSDDFPLPANALQQCKRINLWPQTILIILRQEANAVQWGVCEPFGSIWCVCMFLLPPWVLGTAWDLGTAAVENPRQRLRLLFFGPEACRWAELRHPRASDPKKNLPGSLAALKMGSDPWKVVVPFVNPYENHWWGAKLGPGKSTSNRSVES